MLRTTVHMLLHVAVPGMVARLAFRDRWLKAWIVMLLAIAIDIDHLLAVPVFDPNRCSIGFHPLHSYPAIGAYVAMVLVPPLRLVGLGLLIHMALDLTDCVWIWLGGV